MKRTFSHAYKMLTPHQLDNIARLKSLASDLSNAMTYTEPSRELELAKIRLEEAVMWAIEGIKGLANCPEAMESHPHNECEGPIPPEAYDLPLPVTMIKQQLYKLEDDICKLQKLLA